MLNKEMLLMAREVLETPVFIIETENSRGTSCNASGHIEIVDLKGSTGTKIQFSVTSEKSSMHWPGLNVSQFNVRVASSTATVKSITATMNGSKLPQGSAVTGGWFSFGGTNPIPENAIVKIAIQQ